MALPGTADLGFERTVLGSTPAASKKRATRSVGCAPLDSQSLIRSRSILMRFSLSLASIGS